MISKITPLPAIQRTAKKVRNKIHTKKIIKSTPMDSVRINLERYATEMSPNEYLQARNYLASLERSYLRRFGH